MFHPIHSPRFHRKFRCLLLLFLLWLTGILQAQQTEILSIQDQDKRGGWISGTLKIKIQQPLAAGSKQDLEYVVFWGNNPHQKLSMFGPLAQLKVPVNKKYINLVFKKVQVPFSATHLLLFSRNVDKTKSINENFINDSRMTQISGMLLKDIGVPEHKAQAIHFEQTHKEGNRISGEIEIKRALDERNISHYAIYWGTSRNSVLRSQAPIAVIEKRSWWEKVGVQLQAPWKDSPMHVSIDEWLPPQATHLIAFSRNQQGQMSDGRATKIKSVSEKVANEYQLTLKDGKVEGGKISGTLELEILRAAEENLNAMENKDSRHYLFFWGKDQKTRLAEQPVLTEIEIRKNSDGPDEQEIQVSTVSPMNQEIKINKTKSSDGKIIFRIPENSITPNRATHILVFTEEKYWFQENKKRRLTGPIASYELKTEQKLILPEIVQQTTSLPQTEKDLSISGWRIYENRGIGLGLSLSGLNGIAFFYQSNLDDNRQLHFALDHTGNLASQWYQTLRLTEESTDMNRIAESNSGNILEISRTLFSGTYRWFLDQSQVWGISEGLFYGTGGGLGYASFRYEGRDSQGTSKISGDSENFSSTATDYKHSTVAYGLFGSLEFGWQGSKNYFLQASLQPSFYLFYKDGYQSSRIPVNPNQRQLTNDMWGKAKSLSRLFLGFGIFF